MNKVLRSLTCLVLMILAVSVFSSNEIAGAILLATVTWLSWKDDKGE